MEHFVKLTVVGKSGDKTERVFNIRYIKTFVPSTNTVLLYGNKKPFVITKTSMASLVMNVNLQGKEVIDEKC